MKLLLDTPVLLWWLDDPLRISEAARDRLADPENEVLVSAVSCWEIAIKRNLGKVKAPADINGAIVQCGFVELVTVPSPRSVRSNADRAIPVRSGYVGES